MNRTNGETKLRRLTLSVAVVGLMAGTLAPTASLAAPPPCRAKNLTSMQQYTGTGSNLQSAIDAAQPGTHIKVIGACLGNFVVSKDLVLLGPSSGATLDAGGEGTVLSVEGSSSVVTLRNLTFANGGDSGIYSQGSLTVTGCSIENNSGGGIFNAEDSAMSVVDSTVTGNQGEFGGIHTVGTLKLVRSTVTGNTASNAGGGLEAEGKTVVVDSAISGNTARVGGGIFVYGRSTLRGATLVNMNHATNYGGGIYVDSTFHLTTDGPVQINGNTANQGGGILDFGIVALGGTTQVNGNASRDVGGGIYSPRGSVTLNDSAQVHGNSAKTDGGGISSYVPVTLNDSSEVTGNDAAEYGGGIDLETTVLTLNDSSQVNGNTAHSYGGGVYSFDSSVYRCPGWTGAISPNTPDDPPPVVADACH